METTRGGHFSLKSSSTDFKWLPGLSCSFQAHGPLYLGRAGGMATCRFIVLQSKELWEVFPGKGHDLCVAAGKGVPERGRVCGA